MSIQHKSIGLDNPTNQKLIWPSVILRAILIAVLIDKKISMQLLLVGCSLHYKQQWFFKKWYDIFFLSKTPRFLNKNYYGNNYIRNRSLRDHTMCVAYVKMLCLWGNFVVRIGNFVASRITYLHLIVLSNLIDHMIFFFHI